MSTSIEGLAFALGVQVATSECDQGDQLLALARVGLEAAARFGRCGNEVALRKAQQTFQGAADVLRAELKEMRRVA